MSEKDDDRPPTPVPVRVAVARQKAAAREAEAARRGSEGRSEAHSEGQVDPSPPESNEPRSILWEGTEWSVRLEGMVRSGLIGDSGATLISLFFQPTPESGRTPRRGLVPGRSLSELTDFQLETALTEARDVSH